MSRGQLDIAVLRFEYERWYATHAHHPRVVPVTKCKPQVLAQVRLDNTVAAHTAELALTCTIASSPSKWEPATVLQQLRRTVDRRVMKNGFADAKSRWRIRM